MRVAASQRCYDSRRALLMTTVTVSTYSRERKPHQPSGGEQNDEEETGHGLRLLRISISDQTHLPPKHIPSAPNHPTKESWNQSRWRDQTHCEHAGDRDPIRSDGAAGGALVLIQRNRMWMAPRSKSSQHSGWTVFEAAFMARCAEARMGGLLRVAYAIGRRLVRLVDQHAETERPRNRASSVL